ncbi:hypothetical protein DERF_008810 [Dermatophagoides farinae]|uniref:Uncharacterized protein n=1 Tax=Dermatophagoides farinae TaxID=6954 RepID=A0A922L7C3_DERFA|nr:hypothetical protein DERF_008810 [Dermatophagoides farinae]
MASNVLNSVIYVIPIETRIFFNSFASTLQIHQLNVYDSVFKDLKRTKRYTDRPTTKNSLLAN